MFATKEQMFFFKSRTGYLARQIINLLTASRDIVEEKRKTLTGVRYVVLLMLGATSSIKAEAIIRSACGECF